MDDPVAVQKLHCLTAFIFDGDSVHEEVLPLLWK